MPSNQGNSTANEPMSNMNRTDGKMGGAEDSIGEPHPYDGKGQNVTETKGAAGGFGAKSKDSTSNQDDDDMRGY